MEARLEKLNDDQRPDFCVTVRFAKGSREPERLFRSVASFIESLQDMDELLVQSVDSKIKPVLLLEEIESGSIKVWLKQFLETFDDQDLNNLNWKPAVGRYLVRAKHKVLKYLEGKTSLDRTEELEQLSADIHRLAKSSEAKKLPAYRPISSYDLARGMSRISEAMNGLDEGGSVTMSSDEGDASVTPALRITQEDVTSLLTGETISNEVNKIWMVRRPDFLGDSMWEFRHERKGFSARIDDDAWLAGFRSGENIIRPGDALKVKVLETTTYGKDGEVLAETRVIVKVLGVIRETLFPLPVA